MPIGLLAAWLRKPGAERRLIASAAILHTSIAVAVRLLPFGRVQRVLKLVAPVSGVACADEADLAARVSRAVRTVSSVLPGGTCLTDALVATVLLNRAGVETTLRVGVVRETPPDRPLDAHAWLEHGGATILGADAVSYLPLRPTTRCAPSPSRR
jgi:hypothetical protein